MSPWGVMATKKMEGRRDVVEKQLARIYGEMATVKGELQQVGQLEVKVDSMFTKLSMLEKMEQMMHKWENPKKNNNLKAKEEQNDRN